MKKLLAILLATVLAISGISLSRVESKASDEAVHGGEFGIIPNNPAGSLRYDDPSSDFMNLVTPVIADYAGSASINTVTEEYIADGWVMFEGGMTKEILLNNANYIKMVTNNVLQFSYKKLSEGWPAGSSVTFRKGAPFYYKNTSGALAYYTLNADYKITVNPNSGTAGKTYHTVKVEKITCNTQSFGIVPNNPAGNFNCTGTTDIINLVTPVITDYATVAPTSTVTEDYIANGWVTFAGGMTKEKLLNKMNFIRVVANNVLQFNYQKLTEGWPEGSSVTFKKGAPFYYTSTSGLIGYVTLNADYRITALPGTAVAGTKYHNVKVEKLTYNSQSFGIVPNNPAGNFNCTGTTDIINLVTPAITDYAGSAPTSTVTANYIADGWVTFSGGMTQEKLLDKMNYISMAANNVLQFNYQKLTEGWPEGSSVTFKKGAPIYYTNTLGHIGYVTLNADYRITALPGTAIAGTKYHNVKVEKIIPSGEFSINVGKPAASLRCDNASIDFMNLVTSTISDYAGGANTITSSYVAEGWVSFAEGMSKEILLNKVSSIGFAANNVIQFSYQKLTEGWPEGSYIILKKGAPFYYKNTGGLTAYVTLDAYYLITVVPKSGTAGKTYHTVNVTKSDTVPATPHICFANAHYDGVAAGCTNEGNIEYWTCRCGKYYSDEACTQEITVSDTVIPPSTHTTIHFDAVEATYTSEGNVEYWYCSVCEGFWLDEACTNATTAEDVKLPILVKESNLYDVSAYRSGETYTAPTREGYIFAGWYEDEACTIPMNADVTEGNYYAKFVDDDVLFIKAQVTKGTTATTEETNMRFVSTVDSLDYQKVGFKINVGDREEKIVSTTVVYKQLYANVEGEIDTLLPTDFCESSEWFFTYGYWEIPNEAFDVEFEVTPYVVTADGTTVWGETVVKKVSQSYS